MTNAQSNSAVGAELDRLARDFFHAVSFEVGQTPPYENIKELFIDSGLLIKNVGTTPEISSVTEFITLRQAQVTSGALTRFHESELSERTVIFGNVAHRFSAYEKSGTMNGTPFNARGHDIDAVCSHTERLEDEFDGLGR